jgi:hypothetical protein
MLAEELMESERRNGEPKLVLPAGMELVVPPSPSDEAGDDATAFDRRSVGGRPETPEPRDGTGGARP